MGLFRRKERDEKNLKNEDKDVELVNLIQLKYRQAYSNMGTKHEQWEKNHQAYTGELFDNEMPSYKSNEISNLVFSTIETVKPIMLSGYPKISVTPKEEADFHKAKINQCAIDYDWRKSNMMEKLLEVVHNQLVYGTGITGLFWNQSLNKGLGDTEPITISPFNLYPDPNATNIDNADYIIYAINKSVGEVIKAYPEKAEELKDQVNNNTDRFIDFGKEQNNTNKASSVLYLECYMRDYAVETEIEDELDSEDKPTGNKFEVKKLKYPNGRRVIVAGDVLLSDGENPYEDDGKFPFEILKCYPQPNSFWGMSEVEQIISPQQHMTNIMNSVIENAMLMGNPIWILDKNCGVEKNTLTNRNGLVIRKNPGTEIKRDAPTPLPAYIQNTISDLKYDIERVSGIYDSVRGEKPTGVSSAVAIQALNEQAQGRIKLKVMLLEMFISRLGIKWLSRIHQFWETKRAIKVVGEPFMEDQQQLNQESMKGDVPMTSPDGKPMSFVYADKEDLRGDFDLDVFAGSTMFANKSAKLQLLIQLAQTTAEDGLPMVDRKTILEFAEIMNAEEVLLRFESAKKAQQESQSQQASQQQEMVAQQQQAKAQADIQKEQLKQESQAKLNMTNHQVKAEQMAMEHNQANNAQKAQLEQQQSMKVLEAVLNEHSVKNDSERNKEVNALQNEETAIQSNEKDNSSGIGNSEASNQVPDMEQLMQYLASLPQEELMKLIQQNPELLELIKQNTQNN